MFTLFIIIYLSTLPSLKQDRLHQTFYIAPMDDPKKTALLKDFS